MAGTESGGDDTSEEDEFWSRHQREEIRLPPSGDAPVLEHAGRSPAEVGLEIPPPPRRLTPVRVAILVMAVLAAALLALVFLRPGDDDGPTAADLGRGDCYRPAASATTDTVKVTGCSEEHEAEVTGVVTHPAERGDLYPGGDALVVFADAECAATVEDFVGVSLNEVVEEHELVVRAAVPPAPAWDDGARRITCSVADAGGGSLTRSVEGTGA